MQEELDERIKVKDTHTFFPNVRKHSTQMGLEI